MSLIDKIKNIYYENYAKKYVKKTKRNKQGLSKKVLPEEVKKILIEKRRTYRLSEEDVLGILMSIEDDNFKTIHAKDIGSSKTYDKDEFDKKVLESIKDENNKIKYIEENVEIKKQKDFIKTEIKDEKNILDYLSTRELSAGDKVEFLKEVSEENLINYFKGIDNINDPQYTYIISEIFYNSSIECSKKLLELPQVKQGLFTDFDKNCNLEKESCLKEYGNKIQKINNILKFSEEVTPEIQKFISEYKKIFNDRVIATIKENPENINKYIDYVKDGEEKIQLMSDGRFITYIDYSNYGKLSNEDKSKVFLNIFKNNSVDVLKGLPEILINNIFSDEKVKEELKKTSIEEKRELFLMAENKGSSEIIEEIINSYEKKSDFSQIINEKIKEYDERSEDLNNILYKLKNFTISDEDKIIILEGINTNEYEHERKKDETIERGINGIANRFDKDSNKYRVFENFKNILGIDTYYKQIHEKEYLEKVLKDSQIYEANIERVRQKDRGLNESKIENKCNELVNNYYKLMIDQIEDTTNLMDNNENVKNYDVKTIMEILIKGDKNKWDEFIEESKNKNEKFGKVIEENNFLSYLLREDKDFFTDLMDDLDLRGKDTFFENVLSEKVEKEDVEEKINVLKEMKKEIPDIARTVNLKLLDKKYIDLYGKDYIYKIVKYPNAQDCMENLKSKYDAENIKCILDGFNDITEDNNYVLDELLNEYASIPDNIREKMYEQKESVSFGDFTEVILNYNHNVVGDIEDIDQFNIAEYRNRKNQYYDDIIKDEQTLIEKIDNLKKKIQKKEGYKNVDYLVEKYDKNKKYVSVEVQNDVAEYKKLISERKRLFDMKNLLNGSSDGKLNVMSKNMPVLNKDKENIENIRIKDAYFSRYYNLTYEEAFERVFQYSFLVEDMKKDKDLNPEEAEKYENYINALRNVLNSNAKIIRHAYELSEHEPEITRLEIEKFENRMKKILSEKMNTLLEKRNDKYDIHGVLEYDGSEIDVYKLDDFKPQLIHVLNAYGNQGEIPENYNESWNSEKNNENHGICCSLIAQNNLGMAYREDGVIIGFEDIEPYSLTKQGPYDVVSVNNEVSTKSMRVAMSMYPETLIKRTRRYNENVIERNIIGTDQKRQPDYILCLDKINEEAKKAAKEFEIPIKIIDVTENAKKQIEKIENKVKEFEKTKNIKCIDGLIQEFYGNISGLKNINRADLVEELFTDEKFKDIISKIEKVAKDNSEIEKDVLNQLINDMEDEQQIENTTREYNRMEELICNKDTPSFTEKRLNILRKLNIDLNGEKSYSEKINKYSYGENTYSYDKIDSNEIGEQYDILDVIQGYDELLEKNGGKFDFLDYYSEIDKETLKIEIMYMTAMAKDMGFNENEIDKMIKGFGNKYTNLIEKIQDNEVLEIAKYFRGGYEANNNPKYYSKEFLEKIKMIEFYTERLREIVEGDNINVFFEQNEIAQKYIKSAMQLREINSIEKINKIINQEGYKDSEAEFIYRKLTEGRAPHEVERVLSEVSKKEINTGEVADGERDEGR